MSTRRQFTAIVLIAAAFAATLLTSAQAQSEEVQPRWRALVEARNQGTVFLPGTLTTCEKLWLGMGLSESQRFSLGLSLSAAEKERMRHDYVQVMSLPESCLMGLQ